MTIKNFMKTSMVALLAAMTFVACSDKDDEKEKPAEAAKMLTFGFYQEDNAGVLSKDYVAVIPTTAVGGKIDVAISMPASVDKSELIARFTVNEGNTIAVGGVEQVSQETANDFTVPVDYVITNSDKSKNLMVTVTVSKADNMTWSEVSVLDLSAVTGRTSPIEGKTLSAFNGSVMKINPADNLPYIVVKERDGEDKLSVVNFDGSAWNVIGEAGFSTKVNGSNYSFDISKDGSIYVLYSDGAATNKNGLSLMTLQGSLWTFVGSDGFTNSTAQYVGVAVLENSIIATQQSSKAGDFVKRGIGASFWNGTAWNSESPMSGTYGSAASASNGKEAYLLGVTYASGEPNKYTIVKAKNASDKSVVVTEYLPDGATTGSIYNPSMIVTENGTLYLLATDNAPEGGVQRMRLSVFNGEKFVTVGGVVPPIPYASSGYERHMIVRAAIAPDGTPYIAYNDYTGDKGIYYLYLDSETKQWVDPIKIAAPEGDSADDVNIAFTSTGIGYITYTDANNKIHLFKFAEAEAVR